MQSGQAQLRDWMVRAKLTQRAAAKLLGMHYTFLSQILRTDRSPGLATALKIERLTGVPVEAWVTTAVDAEPEPVGAGARKSKKGKL